MGILTVAVITRPFAFEGKRRLQQAERGLKELIEGVDTMIVIPNEKLLAVAKDTGFFESFRIADDVLRQGVQGISDIITIPGIINRDFADVKTTMAGMGHAVMGTAVRSGSNRAIEAAQAAMASPLLEAGAIDGARGILINITGSSSLKLSEVNEASSLIQSAAHEDANIIFGAVLDEKMGEEVKITVIATGFRDQMPERRARMLSVEEAPVVSIPITAHVAAAPVSVSSDSVPSVSVPPVSVPPASVPPASVPVEAPSLWLNEKAAEPVPAPVPPPAPVRFKSQDEDEQVDSEDAFFFSSSQPAVSTSVTVAAPVAAAVEAAPEYEREYEYEHEEMAAPARPKFDELSEEPGAPPRDYAGDFIDSPIVQHVQEDPTAQPAASMLADGEEEQHRDLDVPAFLRRLRF
jgi:cell division protein FtsZ